MCHLTTYSNFLILMLLIGYYLPNKMMADEGMGESSAPEEFDLVKFLEAVRTINIDHSQPQNFTGDHGTTEAAILRPHFEFGKILEETDAFTNNAPTSLATDPSVFDVEAIEANQRLLDLLTQATATSNTHILAIGIDNYQHQRPLSGCANDACKIVAHFQSQGAKLIDVLINEQATLPNIKQAFDSLIVTNAENQLRIPAGDLVVIYLSGHAARRGGEWFFIPQEFNGTQRLGDESPLNTSAIPDRILLTNAGTLLASGCRVMLILDCCHAGEIRHTQAWSYYIDNRTSETSTAGGMVLLASSIGSQPSLAGTENSRFTQSLLEGLSGRADRNGDHDVTLREVGDYLSIRLRELERNHFKLPGFPWQEQDYVQLSTGAISENLVVARGVTEEPAAYDDVLNLKRRIPGIFPIQFEIQNLLGTWECLEVGPGPDGQKITSQLILHFEDSGQYAVVFQQELPSGALTSKSHEGSFCWNLGLSLEYENGRDLVRVDSLTPEELRLSYFPEPIRNGVSLTFKRVNLPATDSNSHSE